MSNIKKVDQNYLDTKLQELLVCPITSSSIIDPYLTPCGYTVDKSTMQRLIKDKKKDPFTMTEMCEKLVPNHFAKQLIEIIK